MSDSNSTLAATTAAIEAAFDGRWGVWLSDSGLWWAARTHPLNAQQINAGWVPYVRADTPDELMECIREQETLS
jgi:hypothetical protein